MKSPDRVSEYQPDYRPSPKNTPAALLRVQLTFFAARSAAETARGRPRPRSRRFHGHLKAPEDWRSPKAGARSHRP